VEQRSGEVALDRNMDMTDGVDAGDVGVGMKAPRLAPAPDGRASYAAIAELPAADHSPLLSGDLRHAN
jgi:hypothetical protein